MKASYEKKRALIVILVLIVLGVVRYCDDSIVVRNHPRKEFVPVKKIETRIVGYEEYIDQAQKRIKALNETASLAKMVGDRESALAFMKYMEKPKPSCPFFLLTHPCWMFNRKKSSKNGKTRCLLSMQ